MLLHWGILESTNSLTAIRFSQPVQVHAVKIFPTGAQPFKLQPEIVAKTEPSSMYLDVYFNAQPLASGEKQKRAPSNVLVPTCIAYAGDQVEFPVDIGQDYATRLMIIRGKYTALSIAVYGEVVQEASTSDVVHEAKQLPSVPFHALPAELDPLHSLDPSALAQELLSMIPDSPTLQLITRLMFCLKPTNEDWDKPDFPYLYSDLDDLPEDFDLDRAVELTARPVADTVDEEILIKFAARVSETIDLYNDDQAYLFAKLLSQCAPQHPSLAQLLLEHVDMARLYCLKNMDRPTLLYLLDASANLDVSRQLSNPEISSSIEQIQNGHLYDEDTKRAASRLHKRVKGWESFEQSLSNESVYGESARLLKDASVEEASFGILLESLLSHREILDRLLENNSPSQPIPHPPRLWSSTELFSHDEFVAFVRTFIGVASVIAVYAWADSVPVDYCRERALAVLRLWQTIDGYREVVNHLLLMRQMVYRLECMLPIEDDLPTKSGFNAEHILQQLATQPVSMLRVDFVKVMQNLRSPLNYITDEEVELYHQLSAIAKDGLFGAFQVLSTEPEQLDYSSNNLALRVSASIFRDILRNGEAGEKAVLEVGWENGPNNLTVYIVAHLERIESELRGHFNLEPPNRDYQEATELFFTASELMDLIQLLLPIYPLFGRYLATLSRSITGIYVYSDTVDMVISQESPIYASAISSRRSCVNLASAIARESVTSKPYAVTLLKTILECGSVPGNRDVVHYMAQVISLLDSILPDKTDFSSDEERAMWIKCVLPPATNHLRSFFRLQDTDAKAFLIQRLAVLDDGILEVAEWLLLEELQALKSLIDSLDTSLVDPLQRMMQHYSITMSIKTLLSVSQSPKSSTWFFTQFVDDNDISETLTEILSKFALRDLYHEQLGQLAIELSTNCKTASAELRRVILMILLRASSYGNWKAIVSSPELVHESEDPLLDVRFSQELGNLLEAIAQALQEKTSVQIDVADGVLELLNRLLSPSKSKWEILGVAEDSLQRVLEWAASSASVCLDVDVDTLKEKITVKGDRKNPSSLIPTTEDIRLPLEDCISLISPEPEPPSTPKRKSPAETAEMIGLIAVSPPNALLRSPEVKGLTKIYQNNDFRQLRQSSSARQNTSRLPSTHVDDFQRGSSPVTPLNLGSTSPTFAPIPMRPPTSLDPSLPINPNLPMNPYTAFQQ